jgi:HEAT repeat protein
MSRARLIALGFVLTCTLPPRLAHAQAAPQKPAAASGKATAKPAAVKLDLPALRKTLETGNEQAVLGVLAQLAAAKAQAAVTAPLVNELLVRGSSATTVVRALEVAGELAQRSSSAPVVSYLRHRSPVLRRAAAQALGTTGGSEAVAGLRAALHDRDSSVRRIAAGSLGMLRAREAVSDLFAVVWKPPAPCDCAQGDKVCLARCDQSGGTMPEAAAAIGLMCAPEECKKLVDLVGKLPFGLVQSGLLPLLLRPESEVTESAKLDVIEHLRRLQTPEARRFLETVRARYPEKGSAHVRHGLSEAIEGKPVPKPKP